MTSWKQPVPADIRQNKNIDTLSRMVFYEILTLCQNDNYLHCFVHGNKKIELELKRGQCLLQVKKIADDLKINRKVVRRCVEKIKKWYTKLDIKATPQGLVITVLDYDSIIKMDIKGDNEGTPKGHRRDTQEQESKELKENKEINTAKNGRFLPPTENEISLYIKNLSTEKKEYNNFNTPKFFDFYQSKNWMVGKNKMTDWKAAIRTAKKWCIEEQPKHKIPEGREYIP